MRNFAAGIAAGALALGLGFGIGMGAPAHADVSGFTACDVVDAPELCTTEGGLNLPDGSRFAYDGVDEAALPDCEFEDGRRDGKVCVWVDPDTGDRYLVTSQNYR